ncbi:MAG: dehydrogenase, partial [Verrucomicrobiota bacterium]
DGASFKTKDSVFLSCENDPDFHPTSVREDADGSLLVVDTGGWYKICCPTSQLYKPDVLGAIYRIRKTGAPKVEDGRGLKIDWAKLDPTALTGLLDDDRPLVVTRSIHQLAKRKNESIPSLLEVLKGTRSAVVARRNAVWALTQIDSKEARHAIYSVFPDINSSVRPDDTVAQTAFHSISLWRDWESVWGESEAFPATIALSDAGGSENYSMRRIAAEIWGRIGDKQKDFAVHHLLGMAAPEKGRREDRVLEHSITYALIELNDPKTTAEGLTNYPTVQRIALIALDQMDNGGLKPEQVTPLLASSNPDLKQTASWIISHHPEWGGALAGFFREQLAAKNLSVADSTELQNRLAQFAHDGAVQELLTESLKKDSSAAQVIALRALAQGEMKEAPTAFSTELARILGRADHDTVHETVLAARAISPKSKELATALAKVASDPALPDEARLTALGAGANGMTLESGLFDFCIAQMLPAKPVVIRGLATTILTKAKLSDEQLLALSGALKASGPMEVSRLLAAFEKSKSENVGMKLVADLQGAKTVSSLRADRLKPLFAKYPEGVQKKSEALIALLNVDAAKQSAHIDELLTTLKGGDVRRGQMVFNSSKAACSSCHQIGYLGGHVGPDLTSVGKTRTERDLLEALVYPSASFVRSFEPLIVATKSGEDHSGIVKKDSAEEIILVTGPNAEITVARNDITEMRPGTTSVMPGGLAEQLTRQELSDLVAFLKNTQW